MVAAVALVAALVAVVAPNAPTASAASDTGYATDGSHLIPRVCDFKSRVPVDCYWLEVPEHRLALAPNPLRLWVAVLNPQAGRTPLLYLTGGPGDPASTRVVNGTPRLLDPVRPTVVVDQRGTGRSTPRPDCPSFTSRIDPRQPWSQQWAQVQARTDECAAKLQGQGFDLTGYNTRENAKDLADLRQWLGYPEWDVYGLSYGGRLAMELARQDGGGIRRMQLDSPITYEHLGAASLVRRADAAIERASAACDLKASCRANGTLSTNVDIAYARLQARPFITQSLSGQPVIINGDTFLAGVFQVLYRSDLIPLLAGGVRAIAQGDTTLLTALAQQLVDDRTGPDSSNGVVFALISCGDAGDNTTTDRQVIADPGRWAALISDPAFDCPNWPLTPRPLTAPSGTMPVLLTEGQLDPIAPITFFGGSIRRAFPNITIANVRGAGHVVAFLNECTQSISLAFFDGNGRPNTSCLRSIPRPFG